MTTAAFEARRRPNETIVAMSGPARRAVGIVLDTPGEPLDRATRAFMEPRFRHHFGAVRVHTGREAEGSAEALGAAAYTVGGHIVFGAGQHRPDTDAGRRLFAHELTHTIQQAGAQPSPRGGLVIERPLGASEREANRAADATMAGRPVAVTPVSRISLARQSLPGLETPLSDKLTEGASPFLAAAIGSVTVDRFATGKADLDHDQKQKLEKTAHTITVLLRTYSASTVTVTGHTDTVGTELRNLDLGRSRAEVVKAVLVEHGVPEAKVDAKSAGEAPPQAVPTKDETPNAQNRRAEVRFSPRGAGITFGAAKPPLPGAERDTGLGGPFRQGPLLDYGYRYSPTQRPGPLALPGPAAAFDKIPPEKVKRIKDLNDAIEAAGDAVTRDKLVRELRDAVATITPFVPKPEVVKALDDAIKAGVGEGIKKAIQALLEAIAGRSATTMPDKPSHTPADFPPGVPGEHVLPGPSLPFDNPPKLPPRHSFDFKTSELRASYAPGAFITFTLVTPDRDDFLSMTGSKRVVIVADADRSETLGDGAFIESAGPQQVNLHAPATPGKYVIRVKVGGVFEGHPEHKFVVTEGK